MIDLSVWTNDEQNGGRCTTAEIANVAVEAQHVRDSAAVFIARYHSQRRIEQQQRAHLFRMVPFRGLCCGDSAARQFSGFGGHSSRLGREASGGPCKPPRERRYEHLCNACAEL